MKRHDGHISVQSKLNQGTTFTLYLRASSGPLEEVSVDQDPLTSGRGRILVMDDEEMIREGAGELLEDLAIRWILPRLENKPWLATRRPAKKVFLMPLSLWI